MAAAVANQREAALQHALIGEGRAAIDTERSSRAARVAISASAARLRALAQRRDAVAGARDAR